jgi:hypothetical protein
MCRLAGWLTQGEAPSRLHSSTMYSRATPPERACVSCPGLVRVAQLGALSVQMSIQP